MIVKAITEGEDIHVGSCHLCIDLAKRTFQLNGTRDDGSVVFRKKLSLGQVLVLFAQQPKCVVHMQACATAHGWGRALEKLGHDVRLIPPIYVKLFVNRQKNDAADPWVSDTWSCMTKSRIRTR